MPPENVEEYSDRLYSYMRGEWDADRMSEIAGSTSQKFNENVIAKRALNVYADAVRRHQDQTREIYERKELHLIS